MRGTDAVVRSVVRRLAERRRAVGLSQVELNAWLGYADGHVGRWEVLAKRPSLGSLLVWVGALGGRIRVEFPGSRRRPAGDQRQLKLELPVRRGAARGGAAAGGGAGGGRGG